MKKLMLMVMVIAGGPCAAETLVRHCDVPSSTGCSVASIWVKPTSAINVQVARTGAPFVKLLDVAPTERIAACYDPTVVAGSIAKCNVTVPGRSDLWELKSVLYPPAEPPPALPTTITVSWSPITMDTTNQPFSDVTGYRVSRQEDVCGAGMTDPRCGTMPWISEDVGKVTSKTYPLTGRWCFRVQGVTSAGDVGVISVPDADDCNTAAAPKRQPGPVPSLTTTAP